MIEIVQPEGWPRPPGYAHGIVTDAPRTLHVAGQLGMDMQTGRLREGFAAQWEQALANVVAVITAAGGRPTDVVRLRAFVTEITAYDEEAPALAAAWSRHVDRHHYPASTLVEVAALLLPDALVEIEAEAVLR